jgi:hypothetical protein
MRGLFIVVAVICLSPAAAMAQERLVDGLLGALAGAVVAGPVGLVAGGVVGASAGPAIASSWGLNGGHGRHYRHHRRRAEY